jgi:hypothetical protein
MHYRKFLGKTELLVVPYLGGTTVEGPNGRLRLQRAPKKLGWYQVSVRKSLAEVQGEGEAPDLSALPKVRGHLLRDRLVRDGAIAELLHLLPEDEPARFSNLTARRWHSGELVFENVEFDTEAEEGARRALEAGSGLEKVKAVPATLRAAFGYALVEAAARRLKIPFAPAELTGSILEVAQKGPARAEQALRALEVEREQARRELAELARQRQHARAQEEVRAERDQRAKQLEALREQADVRAEASLRAAGAVFREARRRGGNQLEVSFTFMNERFSAIVDAATLQVIDSGICLGHPPRDDLITLESLPSVIKEAVDTHQLVMLRHDHDD